MITFKKYPFTGSIFYKDVMIISLVHIFQLTLVNNINIRE